MHEVGITHPSPFLTLSSALSYSFYLPRVRLLLPLVHMFRPLSLPCVLAASRETRSLSRAPKTQERERNSLAWYTAINPCIYPSILWRNRHLVRLGFIAGSSAGYLLTRSLSFSLSLSLSSSHYRWFNFDVYTSSPRPDLRFTSQTIDRLYWT